MRNKKGQFIKGVSASPSTQFKKGQHWRMHKLFWDKDFLVNEYILNKRSAKEIADDFGVKCSSIYYWLRIHKINRRNTSDIRKEKHWGLSGKLNPMFGKRGSEAGNWKGGATPERQSFYSTVEWKHTFPKILERDNYKCQKCNCGHSHKNPLNIHHIISFAVKEKRTKLENLITVCRKCHRWIHSKQNINKEYIIEYDK